MPVSREDLAEYSNLPLPTGAKLVEFDRFLNAAKAHVVNRTGRVDGTVVLSVTCEDGARTLVLPAVFSASITALTSPSGAAVIPTAANPRTGIVQLAVGEAGVWQVQVVGGTVPADLELAILEIGKHLFGSQRVTAGGRPGAATATTGAAFSVPNRAKELIEPYEMPGFA